MQLPALYTVALWKIAPTIAAMTGGGFNIQAYISVVQIIGMGNLCFLAAAVILTWVLYRQEPTLSPDAAEAR